MTSLDSITIEVADPAAAEHFYATFGVDVRIRASQEPTTGFRGFTLSLIAAQPADVNALVDAAVGVGATVIKPVTKSMWGYGGVVRAPDGTIWKVATSAKKDTGPASTRVDSIVLLLGVADMAASKRFYVDRGFTVSKSFARMYAEFDGGAVKLALYRRRALAKDAGVPPEGTGSHRISLGSTIDPCVDPDGFTWETTDVTARS
ncbi:glyoxalase [Actinokineospora globicatena]|uniref:Glyoxalase n=1 Tax=Actinokineospora globicatena TaxID=103729 RepID=A0A9W6QIE0_9PSEU|nr:glyoxalase [Actinokineospora globicatena]GLW90255.1 glyoxalase [Actinokineospora globicatena]